jgi:hypothetical protein
MEFIVKISVTTKLDGIKSWSLQAIETCPGSIGNDGKLVDACNVCYATFGTYSYPNPVNARAHNKEDWKRKEWVSDMIKVLDTEQYFRWFDSGDVYSLDLAKKIYQVMLKTPNTKHWLPTRMAKFKKFNNILNKMNQLDNVSVRFSSDSINGEFTPGVHGSTILSSDETPKGVKRCTAPLTDGKCSGCRACFDKRVKVVGYVGHGNKMKKIIRLQKIA